MKKSDYFYVRESGKMHTQRRLVKDFFTSERNEAIRVKGKSDDLLTDKMPFAEKRSDYFYVTKSKTHALRKLVHGFFDSPKNQVIRKKGKITLFTLKESNNFNVRKIKTHIIRRLKHGFL